MELVNGHESFLVTVVLSGSLLPVPERHGQLCAWNTEHLEDLMSAFVRLHRKRASLQLLDSSEWCLAAYVVFVREENIILEARSILCAVRFEESRYPPGRHLIFSDNLALELVHIKMSFSLDLAKIVN